MNEFKSNKEKAFRFSELAFKAACALEDDKAESECWLAKPEYCNGYYRLAKSNERRAKEANDWPDMDYPNLFGTVDPKGV